jgi:hypothetical protein
MKRYRYLTPSIRKAIDSAKVQRGRWKYIVVHNSGTRQGNARIFDLYHRNVRKMQNGLAYHFVIGNGNSSGDGQIEIGNRWVRQINGGHVASDYLNDISLGICLVGDLNRDLPTRDQLGALDELCTYLRDRVGKVKGRPAIVKGHKEINPKPTDCPGDRFPLGWLHKRFGADFRTAMRDLFLWFVAGEESGDARAVEVMRAIRNEHPSVVFGGAGGIAMEALCERQFDNWVQQAAVTGLWDVLKNYGYFRAKFDAMLKAIRESKPDAVVLVDYPGFNLRLAQALRRSGYLEKSFITSALRSGPGTVDESPKWLVFWI